MKRREDILHETLRAVAPLEPRLDPVVEAVRRRLAADPALRGRPSAHSGPGAAFGDQPPALAWRFAPALFAALVFLCIAQAMLRREVEPPFMALYQPYPSYVLDSCYGGSER